MYVYIYVLLGILILSLFYYYCLVLRRQSALITRAADMSAPPISIPEPIPRPISGAQLAKANGTNGAPLYIAVKDPFSTRVVVFDVSSGADFYGPGCPYNVFVGKDATHGLAKSSIDPQQVSGNLDELSASEKDTHMQWFAKYTSKYVQVGWLEQDSNAAEGKPENGVSPRTNGIASPVKGASPNGVAKSELQPTEDVCVATEAATSSSTAENATATESKDGAEGD